MITRAKLAICTGRVGGCQAGPRALLHALHHNYALRAKIMLTDFNVAVSTPTAKPSNLIPPSNFPAIPYVHMYVLM